MYFLNDAGRKRVIYDLTQLVLVKLLNGYKGKHDST